MPRVAKTPEEKLAELLGLNLQAVKSNLGIADENSREAEATIELLEGVRKFVQRECSNCGIIFVVDQTNVSKCSDKCRRAHLESLGLEWNPTGRTVEQRWKDMGRNVPLIVPQPVLELIASALGVEPRLPVLLN